VRTLGGNKHEQESPQGRGGIEICEKGWEKSFSVRNVTSGAQTGGNPHPPGGTLPPPPGSYGMHINLLRI
jgi:hypothetical protein